LLYKLLALHPQVAFVSNYDAHSFGRHLAGPLCRLTSHAISLKKTAWFEQDGQAYVPERALLKRWIPAPVEGEPVYRECGLTLDEYASETSPKTADLLQDTFADLQRKHGGEVLLLKRTANNRRIPALMAAFAACRCIVLWRDGRAVTTSLLNVHWWPDHKVWWAGGRSPRQMGLDQRGMVSLAARNWVQEVDAIRRGLEFVDPDRQIHVRYEDLLRDPEATLVGLLRHMGVPHDAKHLEAVRSIGLRPDGEGWRRALSTEDQSIVHEVARQHLESLGYLA
jgi:hypothetical protein